MKKLIILFALFVMLLNGCSGVSDDFREFTIKGYVVSAPANKPISGVLVQVTNDSYILGATSSNEDGSFTLTINRSQLDNSYFLSLHAPQTGVAKRVDIKGVGMSEYDLGGITLYDSRNPCNLPTFEYDGFTYVIHPILRQKYALSEVDSACDGLNDYEINDWFIPNRYEFAKLASELHINESYDSLPEDYYWTSDYQENRRVYMHVYKNADARWGSTLDLSYMAYVVPVSRYK